MTLAAYSPETLERITAAGPRSGQAAGARRHHHGRQRPLGPAARAAAHRGHRRGVQSVRATIEECCRLGIGQLTLYCLSAENWKRPQARARFPHGAAAAVSDRRARRDHGAEHPLHDHRPPRRTCRPKCCARSTRTSASASTNTGMVLCLAINYGGRTEMVDAVRSAGRAGAAAASWTPDDIDETTVSDALYTGGMPDPDLLIRTAGEMRVSNFLLWQISYAELWVTDKCWPDFDRGHAASGAARLRRPRTPLRRVEVESRRHRPHPIAEDLTPTPEGEYSSPRDRRRATASNSGYEFSTTGFNRSVPYPEGSSTRPRAWTLSASAVVATSLSFLLSLVVR